MTSLWENWFSANHIPDFASLWPPYWQWEALNEIGQSRPLSFECISFRLCLVSKVHSFQHSLLRHWVVSTGQEKRRSISPVIGVFPTQLQVVPRELHVRFTVRHPTEPVHQVMLRRRFGAADPQHRPQRSRAVHVRQVLVQLRSVTYRVPPVTVPWTLGFNYLPEVVRRVHVRVVLSQLHLGLQRGHRVRVGQTARVPPFQHVASGLRLQKFQYDRVPDLIIIGKVDIIN